MWNYGGEAIFQVGFDDDILSSGLHGMTMLSRCRSYQRLC